MISRRERTELNALSKEVFGSTSRWQKLIDNGYEEIVTEETEETLPCTDECGPDKECKHDKTKKVTVPKTFNGSNKYVTKYHTVDSVRSYMVDMKKKIDDIKEQIRKHQEEANAAKEKEEVAQQIQEEAGGSAT